MTVIPARVAGVEEVWVASPRPTSITLAAAAVAGADGLLAVGAAQAIAALAFGIFSPTCDIVVGPGNRWVTAAKKHLFGEIGIDGLAGPSEIVIIADGTSDPRLVAADLLAQAEHDPDALPILITDEPRLIPVVEEILTEELVSLSTAAVASPALSSGYAIVVKDLDEAVDLCDRIAPEHLALHVEAPHAIAERFSDYGSLFIGDSSAEVFADYGAGPNHVLPTGGGARFQSGLSVATFLRSPTWMTINQPEMMSSDAAQFARLEGLEGHMRAADLRLQAG
jgi:phosphoribosyl-ATP pyrophosphohydrolase/phosphoribosyl-AMP cyclohydrolase/histidinol dehydrogenase